jgi:phosphoglycerate dehydrogenase-like enzyme
MISLAVTSRSFSQNPILRKKVLKIYPDAKFNDDGLSLGGEALVDFLKDCEKAITALEQIDKSILSKLPDLKVIGKYGVGLDMIDLKEMDNYGVKLGWKGGVNKRSVSELVVSFAISLLHRATYANSEVKKGLWYQIKGNQLTDCTFGIIGCGNIGKDLVSLLKPFGCKILVHDILEFEEFYNENNIFPVGLEELLKRSDVISLHLPLNESTFNILNEERLKMLKKNSILINLARGGLVNESTLKQLLIEGKIAGAALDVFEQEPPVDREFAHIDNVMITPHIGGSTEEAIIAMGEAAIEGLRYPKIASSYLD